MNDIKQEQRAQFVDRLFQTGLATMDFLTISLGQSLGLYQALDDATALTAAELAQRTGVAESYTREWLEQQSVTGVLVADTTVTPPTFRLPPEHAEVLLHETSENYLAPLLRILTGVGRQFDALTDAYRTGAGIPWSAYGPDTVGGQAQFNRPAFEQLLGAEWFPAIPAVHARLQQSDARVADVGRGYGWSSVAIAEANPNVAVDGYDFDAPSIEAAQAIAAERGLADRLHFHTADISDGDLAHSYDLVTVFEALHDMARPVEALQTMRALLRDGGHVLVMDERVGETFTGHPDDIERMMYGWSTLLCLPNTPGIPQRGHWHRHP